MSRLLIAITLFGLLSNALGRLSLGLWEGTNEHENVAQFMKALYGEERATELSQKGGKVVSGWDYDGDSDKYFHTTTNVPANITSSFYYHLGKKESAAWGEDVVEYIFDSEVKGETGEIHAKFKLRSSGKSWTKDWVFQKNGNVQLTAKINDITAKMVFRPTLSPLAQGLWEATSEGKNLDKLNEVSLNRKEVPKEEKFRVSVTYEGGQYYKQTNSSTGNQKYAFSFNEPVETIVAGKKLKAINKYDVALDTFRTNLNYDGTDMETNYAYDNRGAYATYKKGDIVVNRFYRRLIPDELLGKYKFDGREVNAGAFREMFSSDNNSKDSAAGYQTIHLKAKEDKYSIEATFGSSGSINLDFKLGEFGQTTGVKGTQVFYMWQFNNKMGRKVLEAHIFTTDHPSHYLTNYFDFHDNGDLEMTSHIDHLVGKRWFRKE